MSFNLFVLDTVQCPKKAPYGMILSTCTVKSKFFFSLYNRFNILYFPLMQKWITVSGKTDDLLKSRMYFYTFCFLSVDVKHNV